jgi:hypothetical protein
VPRLWRVTPASLNISSSGQSSICRRRVTPATSRVRASPAGSGLANEANTRATTSAPARRSRTRPPLAHGLVQLLLDRRRSEPARRTVRAEREGATRPSTTATRSRSSCRARGVSNPPVESLVTRSGVAGMASRQAHGAAAALARGHARAGASC